ncbi:hypothetical protein K435DRAFT_862975 [Dendrothele bispora CBS 962.96]|uniref:Thioredoxin-like fold domain-containing protein n=1 Tax=Dendrothele bispora (strain CBS 962.96) TaxID=1314807 RepID=A0A4S8LSJ7_DENBC|nr:hypothetical protein K435DRAFT_862975 [Dendrothele bispora CBS 962.96]
MRLPWLPLAFITCVHAQYFSEGWKPGQAVSSDAPNLAPPPAFTPGIQHTPPQTESSPSSKGPLDLTRILSSGPVASLFQKAGINITEKLARMKPESPWDPRIPLITDSNFEEIIINEPLSEEEERDRTWVLIVSGAPGHQGGVSELIDRFFDEAYNDTVIADDIPNLRWGRIDYMNVTYLTTKWAIWQAPSLVILKDRGATLRFYRPQYLRLRDGGLREILKQELYLQTPPWNTVYSPGGDYEFILHYLGVALSKMYNTLILVPRWLLLVVSGSVGSFLIQLMHRPNKSKPDARPKKPAATQAQPRAASVPVPSTSSNKTTSSGSKGSGGKSGGAKQRKSKK